MIATSTAQAADPETTGSSQATGSASPPPASGQPTEEMLRLARRLRMPYLRQHAPDVLATARAQRWDPAEVLRVLLAEEITGRDEATIRVRAATAEHDDVDHGGGVEAGREVAAEVARCSADHHRGRSRGHHQQQRGRRGDRDEPGAG